MGNPIEQKLNMIRSIMEGKIVILIGNSPSVSFLVKNREFFRGRDCVFASMKSWIPIEDDFLKPIDQELTFVCNTKMWALKQYREPTMAFTWRETPNVLMVSSASTAFVDGFNPERILEFDAIKVSNPKLYKSKDIFVLPALHTPLVMILISMLGLAKAIVVFGCDGGHTKDIEPEDQKWCHYKCDRTFMCDRSGDKPFIHQFIRDIEREQPVFAKIKRAIAQKAKVPTVPTYIVGKHSLYEFGDKIDKKDSLNFLETL